MATREQIKYAMERLNRIKKEKEREIIDACTTKAPELKVNDVFSLAKSGKLKPAKRSPPYVFVNNYTDLGDVFDISEYTKSDVIDREKSEPRLKKLEAEFTRVSDELMLGDLKVALKLVEAFQRSKF